MSEYNLDEQVAESFEFTLGGHQYRMKYPTTEEILEGQKLKEGSPEQLEWFYGFVVVEGEGPPVAEALNKVNVKVLVKFNQMIKAEFGVE